jgi:hypothetical protein
VVATPWDCTPRTYAAAARPASSGSSEKHSKLRPASGERWRFSVGASRMRQPLVRASSPSSTPTRSISSGLHVAPSADPQGTQAAVASPAPRTEEPRAPLGPSVMRTEGMPARGTAAVDQLSAPAVSAAFSSSVRPATSASRSRISRGGAAAAAGGARA